MYYMSKFLIKKYSNKDLCDILKENNILVVQEPLGSIGGYYNEVNKQKYIHVNSDLSTWYSMFVIAYQLYNALNNIEYKFWFNNSYDYRSEAFIFAIELIGYDREKTNHDCELAMA